MRCLKLYTVLYLNGGKVSNHRYISVADMPLFSIHYSFDNDILKYTRYITDFQSIQYLFDNGICTHKCDYLYGYPHGVEQIYRTPCYRRLWRYGHAQTAFRPITKPNDNELYIKGLLDRITI